MGKSTELELFAIGKRARADWGERFFANPNHCRATPVGFAGLHPTCQSL
jgi:hypothetical protein